MIGRKTGFGAGKRQVSNVTGCNDLGEMGSDMGGWGSGWRGPKKDVVEDCIVLSINQFVVSKGRSLTGARLRGSLGWRYPDQEHPLTVIRYEVDLRDGDRGCVWLEYDRYGKEVHSSIPLISTTPHYGGLRWWFKCPVKGIRVAKLYLPPAATHFASRQAHDLTYTSCQQSGQSNRFWRSLARDLGRDEAELRASFGK